MIYLESIKKLVFPFIVAKKKKKKKRNFVVNNEPYFSLLETKTTLQYFHQLIFLQSQTIIHDSYDNNLKFLLYLKFSISVINVLIYEKVNFLETLRNIQGNVIFVVLIIK